MLWKQISWQVLPHFMLAQELGQPWNVQSGLVPEGLPCELLFQLGAHPTAQPWHLETTVATAGESWQNWVCFPSKALLCLLWTELSPGEPRRGSGLLWASLSRGERTDMDPARQPPPVLQREHGHIGDRHTQAASSTPTDTALADIFSVRWNRPALKSHGSGYLRRNYKCLKLKVNKIAVNALFSPDCMPEIIRRMQVYYINKKGFLKR